MAKTLRIGIAGTGNRGTLAFGTMLVKRDDCEVVALADPNATRMENSRDYLGLSSASLFTSVHDMVARENLDVVIVTSPDYLHREHICAALRAGAHVLADKPLATSTADCLAIAEAAKEEGRIVHMGFNVRHNPVCRKIKDLISDDVLGNLIVLNTCDYYPGGRTYMSRWNRFHKKSGGLFNHKGTHNFDIVNWFNVGALPVKVTAFAGLNVFTPEHLPFELEPGEEAGPYCEICEVAHKCPDRYDLSDERNTLLFRGKAREADGYNKDTCMYLSEKDVHDNGVVIIEFDNGSRASYWECFFTPISTRRFTLIGDRGHLDADINKNLVEVHPRWGEPQTFHIPRPEGGHGGADPIMLEAFFRNFHSNVQPSATVRDGTLSVAVAEAAEISWREKRMVNIEEILDMSKLEQFL